MSLPKDPTFVTGSSRNIRHRSKFSKKSCRRSKMALNNKKLKIIPRDRKNKMTSAKVIWLSSSKRESWTMRWSSSKLKISWRRSSPNTKNCSIKSTSRKPNTRILCTSCPILSTNLLVKMHHLWNHKITIISRKLTSTSIWTWSKEHKTLNRISTINLC